MNETILAIFLVYETIAILASFWLCFHMKSKIADLNELIKQMREETQNDEMGS